LMCELGNNTGIGLDPAVDPTRQAEGPAADRMTFIADFYSERYADLAADVILCRHTLEHIPDVRRWMIDIRAAIGDRSDALVLFEIPDVRRVLEDSAFWDLYYEHCSYFTLGSLARLFRSTGFEVTNLETDFDDQYLLIEARPSTVPGVGSPLPEENDLAAVLGAAKLFEAGFERQMAEWQRLVSEVADGGGRVVVWGGGSKGVAFLVALGLDEAVPYVVDVNPYKQGNFLAATGQQVVAPEFLRDFKPDLVIAMNSIYRDEIQGQLDELGVSAKLMTV
jgi:hypothetical protein